MKYSSYLSDDPEENENEEFDPDDVGNSWQGMYYVMRCPVPRC